MRTHTRAHWDCYFFFFSSNKDHLPCSLCQIKFRLPVFVLVSFLFFCPKNISRSHYPLAAFTVWHFYLFTIRLTFFLVSDWLFGGDISYLYGPARHWWTHFCQGRKKMKGKEKASVVSVDRRLELLGNTGIVWVSVCVCVSHERMSDFTLSAIGCVNRGSSLRSHLCTPPLQTLIGSDRCSESRRESIPSEGLRASGEYSGIEEVFT